MDDMGDTWTWVALAIILFLFSVFVQADEEKDTEEVQGDIKFHCVPLSSQPGTVVCTFNVDIKNIGRVFQLIPKVMSGEQNGNQTW